MLSARYAKGTKSYLFSASCWGEGCSVADKNNRLVVLASGFGSNLQAVIDACAAGDLDAEVVSVVCDRKKAFSFERAEKAGIPSCYHPWKPYKDAGKDRREFDAALANIVTEFEPTLVILAGWMRVLTSAFLDHFPMRVVNVPGTAFRPGRSHKPV